MNKTLKVIKSLPVVKKTGKTPFSGAAGTDFVIANYVLGDGLNTLLMEKLADSEQNLPKLEEGKWYNVQFRLDVREYTDNYNQRRYIQRVVLERIAEVDNV